MKLTIIFVLMAVMAVGTYAEEVAPSDLLNASVPPPPHRHVSSPSPSPPQAAPLPDDHSLIQQQQTANTELAVDAGVEAELGIQMTAEEQALLNRRIVVPELPKTIEKLEYSTPPLTDDIRPKEQDKLQNALNAVISKSRYNMRQLKDERRWVDNVDNLLVELTEKKATVHGHIKKLVLELKHLLHTKKKIENKQTQEVLKEKLVETHENLKKIKTQHSWVRRQRLKILEHKEHINEAREAILHSLAQLQLKKRKPTKVEKVAKALADLENYDPDIDEEKENKLVEKLVAPDPSPKVKD